MYRLSLFQIIPPLQVLNTRHGIWCSPQNIHLFILWWEKSTGSPLLMAYSRLLTLTCCYITWPCTPSQYYFSTVPHSIKVVISNWSRLEWICCSQSSLDPNNPINRNAEHSSQELKLSLWSTFPLTQTSPKATSTTVMIGRECPSISSLVCIPCQSFSIPANHRPSGLPQFAENSNYRLFHFSHFCSLILICLLVPILFHCQGSFLSCGHLNLMMMPTFFQALNQTEK